MNDMAKSIKAHKVVDLDGLRLTDSVDIIASKVHQHDVFRTILLRIQEFLAKPLILWNEVFRHQFTTLTNSF